MAAGGGGSSGAGKETAGATTLSDLNNFQFQEGKRELEKYRRCDLAEGREEAPKGSRVCGGASLDPGKKAGEQEPGGVGEALRAEKSPPKRSSPRERWAHWARSAEAEGPAGARLPPPRPRWVGLRYLRLGAPCSRGQSCSASSRLHPHCWRVTAGLGPLAPRPLGRSLGGFWLRTPFQFSLAPPLSLFSLSIKAAVGRWAGGPVEAPWPRAVSWAAGYLPGGDRPRSLCAQDGPFGNSIVLRFLLN